MAITSGYVASTSGCGGAIGGVVEFYAVNTSAISSITTSGLAVTNIVFASAGVGFEKFVGTVKTNNFKESMTRGDSGADINVCSIQFNTGALSAADLAIMNTVRLECKQYWVVRVPDGTFYLVGYDPDLGSEAYVQFKSMEHDTGSARTDSHLYTWMFEAEQMTPCYLITGISGASATTAAQIAAELVAATSV